jgi:hypothetical protein
MNMKELVALIHTPHVGLEVRRLRREIQELRAEVRELKAQLNPPRPQEKDDRPWPGHYL